MSHRGHGIKLKNFVFDIDFDNIYLIKDLGPCLKTKGWDYFVPIYGNYEAIEYDIKNTIKLNDENTRKDVLQFYRKDFIKQIARINSKISLVEFKTDKNDLKKYKLRDPNAINIKVDNFFDSINIEDLDLDELISNVDPDNSDEYKKIIEDLNESFKKIVNDIKK